MLASLACVLVFGEGPLPAQIVEFAEEHGLSVALLHDGIELQLVLARLASLIPTAAEAKEMSLAGYTNHIQDHGWELCVPRDVLQRDEEDEEDDGGSSASTSTSYSPEALSRSTSTKSEDVRKTLLEDIQALREMGVLDTLHSS
eukprot:TRINITY_DN21662_c0_g2_i2.p1 TRINITY_DN21662_c0_g2~~TRINITY_DN21662_c0_g2_i2.p1  ORF type:complete len:144 (-),score=30.21 TRINITY_DN21662_c0_g2_i2:203-634(-)